MDFLHQKYLKQIALKKFNAMREELKEIYGTDGDGKITRTGNIIIEYYMNDNAQTRMWTTDDHNLAKEIIECMKHNFDEEMDGLDFDGCEYYRKIYKCLLKKQLLCVA
jgi:hypothetical protein